MVQASDQDGSQMRCLTSWDRPRKQLRLYISQLAQEQFRVPRGGGQGERGLPNHNLHPNSWQKWMGETFAMIEISLFSIDKMWFDLYPQFTVNKCVG